VASDSGVRGYAHVIKEDTVRPDLLFLGTEFGLWVSPDSGKQWAQYKGHDFPRVPVDDLVVHPRDSDLIVATHGRGIWIMDDITPLRHLTPEITSQAAAFLPGRPQQQRIETFGGWEEGSATFTGPNPPTGVTITWSAFSSEIRRGGFKAKRQTLLENSSGPIPRSINFE
jgi:hypothetical protein